MKMPMNYGVLGISQILLLTFLNKLVSCQNQTLALKTKPCSCGNDISIRGRIIGGVVAEEHEFPWQVAIYYKEHYQCGGSLINDRYILSAGHCFKIADPRRKTIKVLSQEEITFVIGAHDLNRESGKYPKLIRTPESIIVHKFFNPYNYFSDIAVIKLNTPIENYTFNIMPICLPPLRKDFVGYEAVIAGWGATYTGGGHTDVLMKTTVQVLPQEKCAEKLKVTPYDGSVMMCAVSEGHDACQGDSGGPLVTRLADYKYYQIGVVSFGIGCGDINYPGIYTALNKFAEWLLSNTQDGIYCDS